MRRREFIALIGGALAWPLVARAQRSGMPVIGFLRNTAPNDTPDMLAAFRAGLAEVGYEERRNVMIEYRWARGRTDLLPSLAAELVDRQPSVIVTLGSSPAALAAKAATTTIPVVFMIGADPVEIGLVSGLGRPDSNLTGVFNLNRQVAQKWLEVLHQLVPQARTFALLLNPRNVATSEFYISEVQTAARMLGLQLHIMHAGSEHDFDTVFANLRDRAIGGLVIAADLLFIARMEQLAALTLRHGVPAIYPFREFPKVGGLASYGSSLADTYRLAGVYTGRILKGERPADLPVQQSTKVELVINLASARALGLTISPTLLARADEVIE